MVDFARMRLRALQGHQELIELRTREVVVAVSGTRENPSQAQRRALSTFVRLMGAGVVVHGDCAGVDAMAHETAMRLGLRSFAYPSDLARWRVDTGAVRCCEPMHPTSRNEWIVRMGHVLIALPSPSSRGTWDAVRRARYREIPCVVVDVLGRIAPHKTRQVEG